MVCGKLEIEILNSIWSLTEDNEDRDISIQDIVDYLLSHQSLLHKLSTRDIAKKVYCSSSALIRLAHKLGFQGYSQLKEQLIKEQEYLDSHFDHIDANIPFTELTSPLYEISPIIAVSLIVT